MMKKHTGGGVFQFCDVWCLSWGGSDEGLESARSFISHVWYPIWDELKAALSWRY